MLSGKARLQYVPEAKRYIRIFRRVSRGAVDGHTVECNPRLALARDLREGNRLVVQVKRTQLVHAVTVKTGIEHI